MVNIFESGVEISLMTAFSSDVFWIIIYWQPLVPTPCAPKPISFRLNFSRGCVVSVFPGAAIFAAGAAGFCADAEILINAVRSKMHVIFIEGFVFSELQITTLRQ
jgi:hypothetical protein